MADEPETPFEGITVAELSGDGVRAYDLGSLSEVKDLYMSLKAEEVQEDRGHRAYMADMIDVAANLTRDRSHEEVFLLLPYNEGVCEALRKVWGGTLKLKITKSGKKKYEWRMSLREKLVLFGSCGPGIKIRKDEAREYAMWLLAAFQKEGSL